MNKYLKAYNALIYKRKFVDVLVKDKMKGQTECHHIIPRSCGGADTTDNLVDLTIREHYIAHLLLIQIYKNTPHFYGMLTAITIMIRGRKDRKTPVRFNSRLYEKLRVQVYQERIKFYEKRRLELLKAIRLYYETNDYYYVKVREAFQFLREKSDIAIWHLFRRAQPGFKQVKKPDPISRKGMMIVNDGLHNRFVPKNEPIDKGWNQGILRPESLKNKIRKAKTKSKWEHFLQKYYDEYKLTGRITQVYKKYKDELQAKNIMNMHQLYGRFKRYITGFKPVQICHGPIARTRLGENRIVFCA